MSLSLIGLEKRYGKNSVVRGLNLELPQGEIVALLGPSGCGKTTALRMVAGLERPDAGQIVIAGQTVFDSKIELAPERRQVGMVFQSYAVWPHKNLRANVAYPLQLQRNPDANRLADEALATVRLAGMGDRLPSTLSGGQQQRVALARALVAKPRLLLFDEPLSNLDAALREEMRHEIRQLAKATEITALYVTHDQAEAFAVSDRVAVVLQGKIAQLAPPEAIYAEPATLSVARFVGRIGELRGVWRDGRAYLGAQPVEALGEVAPGPVVIAIRPEAATLGPGLGGRVARATFLGERAELVIDTDYGQLRLDVPAAGRPHAGDQVSVHIRQARAFSPEET